MVKDPKIEHIGEENILKRGSIVKHTSWVFAMVLATGMDNEMMKMRRYPIRKNELVNYQKFQFIILIFISCLFALLSEIVLLSKAKNNYFISLHPTDLILADYIVLYS